jgi:hypothetical protein
MRAAIEGVACGLTLLGILVIIYLCSENNYARGFNDGSKKIESLKQAAIRDKIATYTIINDSGQTEFKWLYPPVGTLAEALR